MQSGLPSVVTDSVRETNTESRRKQIIRLRLKYKDEQLYCAHVSVCKR